MPNNNFLNMAKDFIVELYTAAEAEPAFFGSSKNVDRMIQIANLYSQVAIAEQLVLIAEHLALNSVDRLGR